jgi:hypothetical protein
MAFSMGENAAIPHSSRLFIFPDSFGLEAEDLSSADDFVEKATDERLLIQ